jgi:hypothetical protein
MTLRSGLRNNRKNETGAAIVGGIGDFLQNYAKSKQSRMAIDLDAKTQEISKARSEEDARANRAIEDYRKKQLILDESRLNFDMGKKSAEDIARSDNFKRLMSHIDEAKGVKDIYRAAAKVALLTVGATGDVKEQNDAVNKWLGENWKPEKAEGVERGKGGLTKTESMSSANTIIDNERQDLNSQVSDLNAKAANAPTVSAQNVIYEQIAKLREGSAKNRPGGLESKADSLYNGWMPDRLKSLRDTVATQTEIPAAMSSRGTAVVAPAPAQDLSQIETAPPESDSGETNAKAMGLIAKMVDGGESRAKVLADFRNNKAKYVVMGVDEKLINDVFDAKTKAQ